MLAVKHLHTRAVHVAVWEQCVHLPLAVAALEPARARSQQLDDGASALQPRASMSVAVATAAAPTAAERGIACAKN